MNTKHYLALAIAKIVVETAEKIARENKWQVSIAIVNETGQLIYFIKMDETTNISGDISILKAQHAANYRRDTIFHEILLMNGNNFVLSLPNSMPLEGGVQLIYQGKTIGAIGVSGVDSEDDGKIAKAGADYLLSLK